MSGIEITASIIAIIQISSKIFKITTQFGGELRSIGDRGSDLASQVNLLHRVLPTLEQTLGRRRDQIAKRPGTVDELKLLEQIENVLGGLDETVGVFADKVASLGGGNPGGWNSIMMQLRLMMSGSDIASLEKRISSELSALQLMMICYSSYDKFMENEMKPGYTSGEVMTFEILEDIENGMQGFREQLNRVTDHLGVDPTDYPITRDVDTENGNELVKDERSEVKMMLHCFDAANLLKQNLSRSGSVVSKDESNRRTESIWPENTGCYDPELQAEVIRRCKRRAEQDLERNSHNSAEYHLLRGIGEAKKRERYYKKPFDERYKFESMLAKAYLGQSKLDEAEKTLTGLEPVAERSSADSAELWRLIAELRRRQYQSTQDADHFKQWNKAAVESYNRSRTLTSMPEVPVAGDNLLSRAISDMVELHECKKDPLVIEILLERHPDTQPAIGQNNNEQDCERRSSARSFPPLQQPTLASSTTSRTDSVASAPTTSSGEISLHPQASNIFEAIRQKDERTIIDLLEKNVSIAADTNGGGRTPLMCAVKSGNVPLVKILLPGSPIRSKDKDDKTALHHALLPFNHKDMLQTIIQHKDITKTVLDAADNEGRTPLHYCVQYQRLDDACILIAHGATLDIRDICGDTPAELAEFENRLDFIKLLDQASNFVHSETFQSTSVKARHQDLREMSTTRALSSSSRLEPKKGASSDSQTRKGSSSSSHSNKSFRPSLFRRK